MAMNALQKELVVKGFAQEPKPKKFTHKPITCRKCGHELIQEANENFAYCHNCNNFLIFDENK